MQGILHFNDSRKNNYSKEVLVYHKSIHAKFIKQIVRSKSARKVQLQGALMRNV